MTPGRKSISFYTGRVLGGNQVWYFVGVKGAFPSYHGMTAMRYSNHVRGLWPAPAVEPILAFLEEHWGTSRDTR